MANPDFIETMLYGFFRSDFVSEGRLLWKVDQLADGMLVGETTPPTRIYDARELQSRSSLSEACFFEDHGFVLLPHETAVVDWEVDPEAPDPASDAMRTYLPEVETLIRSRLLPGRRLEIYQFAPMRRGPGSANPFYGSGVHSDYGLTPDDYQESLEAFSTPEIARGWRHRYEQDDVEGFVVINFWRTVYSNGPLLHMPLGVCDPRSVELDDCVPVGLLELTPTGKPTNQLSLRQNPGQVWYYYPAMTGDEALAFKNFECSKNAVDPYVNSCFHSAFEHPGTPPDVEERQSCEHRASIYLLRD